MHRKRRYSHDFRPRERYGTASAMCAMPMVCPPAKSAIIRANFKNPFIRTSTQFHLMAQTAFEGEIRRGELLVQARKPSNVARLLNLLDNTVISCLRCEHDVQANDFFRWLT